jgi:hypothetical protein
MSYSKTVLASAIAVGCCCAPLATHADVIAGSGVPGNATLGATTATQFLVHDSGTGHQLIVPYYTTQAGNATLLSLTNTDTLNGKVLKLRFRGAGNADNVMDMTVLLAPRDVWTAGVTESNGLSQLSTADRSCTVPRLEPNAPVAFRTGRLSAKDGGAIAAGTREGHVEVINVADVPAAALYGATGDQTSALYNAIRHPTGVAPCTEGPLAAALLEQNLGNEAQAAALGLAGPTGGVSGKWSIINVPQTTTYSGEMTAIRAADAGGRSARANFALFPQTEAIYAGDIDRVTSDPLLRNVAYAGLSADGNGSGATATPALRAANFDLPDLSTPYLAAPTGPAVALAQAAQLTAALAVRAAANDFATEAVIQGRTDWVHAMPTRRLALAMDYGTTPSRALYSQVLTGGKPYFHQDNTLVRPANLQQICVVPADLARHDREGHLRIFVVVPSPVKPFQLCGSSAVHAFNVTADNASALGASLTREEISTSNDATGWASLEAVNAATGLGLPLVSHAFVKASNPAATPGVSGTYGFTSRHTLVK